jgi:hypothetical protein
MMNTECEHVVEDQSIEVMKMTLCSVLVSHEAGSSVIEKSDRQLEKHHK